MTIPRIAFCTTCKNRTPHLRETLPRNIADNADYPNCVFIVMDYGDAGELRSFLNTQQDYIKSGRLVTYRHDNGAAFHVSHAKNMAARCGIEEGADILVTLDADNFTGYRFAQFVADEFNKLASEPARVPGIFLCPDFPYIQSLPHGPARPQRGFAGRLAIRSMDFIKLGGYDEYFDTWRGEDLDMIARLTRMGWSMRHIPNQYLNVIPHAAGVRFAEYPHAREYENNWQTLKVISARKATIVNFGNFGVGKVYRNFGLEEIRLQTVPTRIFGIGMQRTATTSLHEALSALGFDSFHWGRGEAPMIYHEMKKQGRSHTLEQWYALSDTPIPLLYKELDKAYPGSKFILTIRDEQKWLKSVEALWDYKRNPMRSIWDKYPFSHYIHTVTYGRRDFDPQTFLERYRRHNAEVRAYFKGRDEDLLVMDMERGAGWVPLAGFLGRPIPGTPYPCVDIASGYQPDSFKSVIMKTSRPTANQANQANRAYLVWAGGCREQQVY